MFICAAVQAQFTRTAVSISGLDSNDCSVAAPCRSFARAMTQTLDNGEIIALTTGGYGPFVIERGLKVHGAPGIIAAISALTGSGIIINTGATVTLESLHLLGLGGAEGIDVRAAYHVFLDNMEVEGFDNHGLIVAAEFSNIEVVVTRSAFRRNGNSGSAGAGIYASGIGGMAARVTASDVQLTGNNFGIHVLSNGHASLRNSVLSANAIGARADSVATLSSSLMISNVLVSQNINGIVAGTGVGGDSKVRVSECVITDNDNAVRQFAGGTLVSAGDNVVEGNLGLETFPATFPKK